MVCISHYARIGKKVMAKLIENPKAFEWVKVRAKDIGMSVVEYCGKYKYVVYRKMEELEK